MEPNVQHPRSIADQIRMLSVIGIVGMLLATSFLVVRPFLPALVWGATIVIATWPLLIGLQKRLGGSRGLAVAVMTLAMLLLLIVPFASAVRLVLSHTDDIANWARSLKTESLQEPPKWLTDLPFVGGPIDEAWRKAAAEGSIGERASQVLRTLIEWFAAQAGTVGVVLLQFLLTIIASAVLYAKGESVAAGVRALARKLGGERGNAVLDLAVQAVRGVALGVVVTSLIQALLGGIGLAVAGLPFVPVLMALMLLLALAQIGVWPVLGGSAVWLFMTDQTGWGIAMIVWTVLVGGLDNVMRPFLIRRGVKLSLILIFVGVVGGLMAFGLIGIFLGPMILGVTQTLIAAWVAEGEGAARANSTRAD
jgi:predicted PurR-regulated permease PerM